MAIFAGGASNDVRVGGSGFDHFVFGVGDSGHTTGNFDIITDFFKGAVGTGDEIDYATAIDIGGTADLADSNNASINQTTGVTTFFAGSGATLSDALDDIESGMDDDGRRLWLKMNLHRSRRVKC